MIKETFKQYKWVLVAGVITAILLTLITANLHVFQFMGYKIQHNTDGIISIMKTHMKGDSSDWLITEAMNYVLDQDEYTDEMKNFFEVQFGDFSDEQKQEIIRNYNRKQLWLPMNETLMQFLVQDLEDDITRAYIKRLDAKDMEQGLVYLYGANPVVNTTFIEELAKMLAIYPGTLNFEKFQFNLYELLSYTGEQAQNQQKLIISKLPSDKARETILKELRNQSITEEQLCTWVNLLNDMNLITLSEYTSFNNTYSEIVLVRNQYNALDDHEVELQNKKEQVDLQISANLKLLESKKTDLQTQQATVSQIEQQLEELTNYTHMALYIEQLSGTGANEYIASIPRNGLFGFRPSNQKYIVKLQDSSLGNEGVQYLDLFYKGTKASTAGENYAYYVQVSSADLTKISTLQSQRTSQIQVVDAVKQEVGKLENEIDKIKRDNQYDEIQAELMGIAAQREELSNKLAEKTLVIKELFGLKDLKITLVGNVTA